MLLAWPSLPEPFRTRIEASSSAKASRCVLELGIAREGGGDRVPDPLHVRDDDVAARARDVLGGVARRREHERADVARVDRARQPGELRQLRLRDVGPDRRLQGVDELRDPRDQVRDVGLLAERRQDPLLAGRAVEVALAAVARPGVDERLGAGHVLDAGRDVDPREPAGVGRVGLVDDRDLDVDRHAAHRVDDLLEAVEVDLDEVLDVEAVEVAQDRLQAVVAARDVRAGHEVGPVADRGEEGVDLARVDAADRRSGAGPTAAGRRRCRAAG